MRRCVIVIAVILALVVCAGGLCEGYNSALVRRYRQVLLPISAAIQQENWQEAARQTAALAQQWDREAGWVQLWIHHAETDAVSHALNGLSASLAARDTLSSWLYYGECIENFAHLHHRDAFTLKNIL